MTFQVWRLLGAFLVVSLFAAACSETTATTDTTVQEVSSTEAMGDDDMDTDDMESEEMAMDDMDMNMGDASAVRADEVPGAELESGAFVLLDSRPPGYDAVAGDAFLARHDAGTTVTIALTGLPAEVDFIAHVHDGLCVDNGGDHYQFEVGGSDMPPNEIHLAFTSGEDGSGFMTAENASTVDDRAQSLVVHPSDLLDNKAACVEFSP